MLEVKSLEVFYNGLQVIWGTSFSVAEGSITALIGANGVGKTTILNTIAGLLPTAGGEIIFLGERIERYPAYQRVELGISLVPEGRRVFPYLSVLENLEMGAYSKRARGTRNDNIAWVFDLFPILKERRRQQAGMLSGGEQQMLAIGRGLMSRPKLLMLDEPSLGLAPRVVLMLYELIEKINRERVTILLVEQNVEQALNIAHMAFVLEAGRITLKGSGQALLGNEKIKRAYLGL